MSSSRFAVAVHVLAVQAMQPDEALTSEYVASSVNTNPVVVRRLLGLLRRAGLVRIQPGPHGGSRLTCSPARVKLSQIYRAVEQGKLVALHRARPNPQCPVGRNIEGVLVGVLSKAERSFERVLERTTLADVTGALRKCVAKGA